MDAVSAYPNCGGDLPGLGGFFGAEKSNVVCRDCGSTRFFARQQARERLRDAKKWTRVSASRARRA